MSHAAPVAPAPIQAKQKAAPASAPLSGLLQRKCACGQHTIAGGECEECRRKREGTLQRAAINATPATGVPPIVHDVLNSPGQPLDAGTRAFMEPRFGQDFSQVRVHTGSRAAESAQAVNALAYTVGRNVVFGPGQYAPGTSEGRRLLAHELTHVVQQLNQPGLSQLQEQLVVDGLEDHYEQEAERVADMLTKNIGHTACQRTPSMKDRQPVFSLGYAPLLQRQRQDESGQRPSTADMECPGYERNELQVSHTEAGHLEHDVFILAPGRLLIADFGVDWRHVKRSTADDPILRSWLHTFETNDSYRLSIIGYSDCVGVEGHNTDLRQGRALHVEGLLGPSARSRVTFRGMAALGDYVDNNQSVTGRARNRGVVIEFQQDFTFTEPEEVTATPRRCGPDVTQWLIDRMNENYNHPVIQEARENRWPRYVPVFNIGWTAGALNDFAQLVRGGGPWDYKSNQRWWRAHDNTSCPTNQCDRTVTICDRCFNYDVPGNIHFGFVGRAAEIASWMLHTGAGIVQPGQWTDDPKDAVAIDIGIAIADEGATLCDQLEERHSELNLQGTENCAPCGENASQVR